MKLYTYKQLNCGFVILCPNHNGRLLSQTINSIKSRYPDAKYIGVIDDSIPNNQIKEMQKICKIYKGKSTFSSLINVGMNNTLAEWNFITIAGTTPRKNMDKRFSLFIENEKDILFPISDRQANFVDGTINGLFINKKTFKEVGDMANSGPLDLCKLMWFLAAIQKECKFKAIANCTMC